MGSEVRMDPLLRLFPEEARCAIDPKIYSLAFDDRVEPSDLPKPPSMPQSGVEAPENGTSTKGGTEPTKDVGGSVGGANNKCTIRNEEFLVESKINIESFSTEEISEHTTDTPTDTQAVSKPGAEERHEAPLATQAPGLEDRFA